MITIEPAEMMPPAPHKPRGILPSQFIALVLVAVAGVFSWGEASLLAQELPPRHANYERALEMARVLDKGEFQEQRILATFIRRVSDDRYVVRLQLDNGGEHEWDMHQLRRWTQGDALVLRHNRALVFTSKFTNDYQLLDKNRFTRQALRSRYYRRVFREPDLLAGQAIVYRVRTFNMTELLGIADARDPDGYPYRYVLDLYTGERELLSYLQAYRVLQEGDLGEESSDFNMPAQRKPYILKAIRPLRLIENKELGITEFGVSLIFDRPLTLRPVHYPFQFYEKAPARGTRTPRSAEFIMEVILPNSRMDDKLAMVRQKDYLQVEFMQDIHAVPDRSYRGRLLLRGRLNASLLRDPPKVGIAQNVVSVSLVRRSDQSVPDLIALRQEELRRNALKWISPLNTEAEQKRQSVFEISMRTGMRQMQRVRVIKKTITRYETYQAALANFNEAALHAATDPQLKEALLARNGVLARIPREVYQFTQREFNERKVTDAKSLLHLVREVMLIADDPKIYKFLDAARKHLQALIDQKEKAVMQDKRAPALTSQRAS